MTNMQTVEMFPLGHIYVQKVNLASNLLGAYPYISRWMLFAVIIHLQNQFKLRIFKVVIQLEQTEQSSHTTERPQLTQCCQCKSRALDRPCFCHFHSFYIVSSEKQTRRYQWPLLKTRNAGLWSPQFNATVAWFCTCLEIRGFAWVLANAGRGLQSFKNELSMYLDNSRTF